MKFERFIALRYLLSNRNDRYFSWTAALSVVGVGIGVATMIVVLSVINGFESELRNRFLNANSHIMLFRYPDGVKDYLRLEKDIAKDYGSELTGVSAFIHMETMARKGGVVHSVLVRAFDANKRESVQSLHGWVKPDNAIQLLSSANRSESEVVPVIVGEGVLRILDLKSGDEIQILSPADAKRVRPRKFEIIGSYHTGLKHYDNRLIAMPLSAAQDFFAMPMRATGVEVGLKLPDESPRLAKDMGQKYSLTAKEWTSFNKPLLDTIRMERTVIFLIVCIVAVVASMNILTTLFVSVSQKQREISILRALGATQRQVVKIFLQQGAIFGVLGSTIGVSLALGIALALKNYNFIDLPDPYYVTQLPVEFDWRVYSVLALSGVLLCVVAGVFPAYTAAKVQPTHGLKGNDV